MADIMYKWGKGEGSVGMSDQVELPQFKVKGLKQFTKAEYLSTGLFTFDSTLIDIELILNFRQLF